MAKFKQTNEDGTETEIEAFTPEEVKLKEDEFNTKITTLAEEKKQLEEEIKKSKGEGLKDDHPNFKTLKEALDKKDDDIKKLQTDIEVDRSTRKQEAFDAQIKIASKGNDEFEKKVRFHLEKTVAALPDSTADERKVKLDAALKLSSDTSTDGPGMFDGGIGVSGVGSGATKDGDTSNGIEFTAREKALGAKMGITPEDYKKFSSRLSK